MRRLRSIRRREPLRRSRLYVIDLHGSFIGVALAVDVGSDPGEHLVELAQLGRAVQRRADDRADTQSIAELMGHTSTRMTERYAHSGKEQRQALVNKAFNRRPRTGAPTATPTATTMPSATVPTDAAPRKRAVL